jgi:hypothetical protein
VRLFLDRDQAKGFLGGVKFELTAKVELTPEEAELVRRYKADKEVLIQKEVKVPFTGKSFNLGLTIGSLTSGQACEAFKTYLDVMKHFGGQEIIEYK